MQDAGDIYEYVLVYIDDLAFAVKCPEEFVRQLKKDFHFKLKGIDMVAFHLSCDFFRNKDGILCMAPRKYIEKVVLQYEKICREMPRTNVQSPLEKGDRPELNDTKLLKENSITQYQSIHGQFPWGELTLQLLL